MTNATMTKFGYPQTLIREYDHWCVLLRPAQVTLGALVLVCKDDARAFSAISAGAFAELAAVTDGIERSLGIFRAYEKINYLMLMMVDPDVHFHVIPRYSTVQTLGDVTFEDAGWPGVPDLSKAVTLEPGIRDDLIGELRAVWYDPAD